MNTQEEIQAQTNATTPANRPQPPPARGRRKAFMIFFMVLLVIAAGGLLYWLHARQFESTDDAQVDAHLNPVTARIDGTITRVYVENNQIVQAGQLLVELDPRDYQVALDQSLAQLAQARSMVVAQQPNVPITQVENATNISTAQADVANAQAAVAAAERDRDSSAAKVAEAEANNAKAQADLKRYQLLIAKEEVSQKEFDQISAAANAQAANVAASQASLQAAARTVDQRHAALAETQSRLAQYRRNAPAQLAIRRATLQSNEASAQSAQAQVEEAQLKLGYSKITAPVAGIVMKRSAEVGARISAGQQLMQIVQMADLWVTANFKETQLRNLHPNQSATIHVDALKEDFAGYVLDIGGSTGSVASVLPPENATGNFVKVVQRIPVRIRFKAGQRGLDRLRPGMSVEPEVRIGG
ncbi:MAG: HlyD family secretion protein [Acidobacteriaceae bacterium]|nr:HlyD family secretion protein [Acidobacteriaceae bacterium]